MSSTAPDQPPFVPPKPVDPSVEIDAVLIKMLDRLFVLVATLGVVTIAVNSARVMTWGYNPSYATDIIAFSVLFGVLALRRRLPIRLVFGVVVSAIVVLGLVSLATLGLASAGMMILTTGCILVGVFTSLRTGVITAFAVFSVVCAIGLLHGLGVLAPLPRVEEFIAAPSSWATQATALLVCVLAVVLAATSVRTRLTRSLEELNQRGAELARIAEQLRESEGRHRLLADNITDVVFVQGLDLRVLYLSQSAEQLFGRDMDDLFRLGMAGVLTPESLRRAQEVYLQYLPRAQRGEAIDPPLLEFEYMRPDGSTFWGELRVQFVRDANGTLLGSQGVLRDITERRRNEQERLTLEERLREAEKLQAIGQLAGGVAHDFNNQLSAIMGFADLMQSDPESSASARSHAGNILLAARRSADLTNKLLAFARRTHRSSVIVDIHAIVGEVVAMLERTVDRNIQIGTHLEARRSTVLGDPTQLVSAFLNLGLNARDAMPRGGRLVFATALVAGATTDATDDRTLEVRVTDTGSGMDPETVRHAFEPFFTRKDLGKGTGLGLAAVYGTMRSHDGIITIDSSPGNGTTFRVLLPLHDSQPPGTSDQIEPAREQAKHSSTVMVVDDEELVGRATSLALERAGHRVRLFSNPTEALSHYHECWQDIDLVVIDMIMPEMSGQELFIKLQALNPDTAVVLTSGHVPASAVQELIARGAREFLPKPFTPSELAAVAGRVLTGSPARRA